MSVISITSSAENKNEREIPNVDRKPPHKKKKQLTNVNTHSDDYMVVWQQRTKKNDVLLSALICYVFIQYAKTGMKMDHFCISHFFVVVVCALVLKTTKKKWERKEKKNGLFVIILVVMYKSLEREMWTLLMLVHSLVSDVGTSTHFFSLSHLILVAHDDDASINNKKMKAIILYIKKWEEKYIYAS